jgi:hypothetical protein
MMTGFLVLLNGRYRIAADQRRDNEAWRAWHRRPDAPPMPEKVSISPGGHGSPIARLRLMRGNGRGTS